MFEDINPVFILAGGVALLGGTLAIAAMNKRHMEVASPYDVIATTLNLGDVLWAIRNSDALYKAGQELGRELTIGVERGNMDRALAAMNTLGIGKFSLETTKRRSCVVVEGGAWQGAPSVDEPLCYMTLGVVRTVVAHVMGGDVRVTEESCHGTGAAQCSFKLEMMPNVT